MGYSIYEYLGYNNILYKELTDDKHKKEVEAFVKKLEQEPGVIPVITSLTPAHTFFYLDFDHSPKQFSSSLPEDLTYKMMMLWFNRHDSEYRLPEHMRYPKEPPYQAS